jgi:hypothetical protein
MKDKDIQRWEKARQKGMLHCVFVRGTVSWGIPMFVVMTFIFRGNRLPVWASALLWLGAGTFFGLTLWLTMEFLRRRTTSSQRS